MSSWASWFGGGRKDSRESARDAIVGLRQQLLMLEKKEEFLTKKIGEEMQKARANATSNKRCKRFLSHFLIATSQQTIVAFRAPRIESVRLVGSIADYEQWPWPR